jgi:superfamily II DNA/RNA helicase
VYAVVLAPTRELAKQIHQQVVALGSSAIGVRSALVVGGLDATRQSVEVGHRDPHFCVATPGRLAYLLRGPSPPRLQHARYLVLDEADRLLAAGSGFERDVAELLLHCSSSAAATSGSSSSGDGLARPRRQTGCQTLLFSATMTRSLDEVEEMAGAGMGRLPLTKIVVGDDLALDDRGEAKAKGRSQSERAEEGGASQDCDADSALTASSDSKDEEDDGDSRSLANGNINHPKVPAGLKQEYVFMPSRVRDAYLLATLRALMENGGRPKAAASTGPTKGRPGGGAGWNASSLGKSDTIGDGPPKARSAIVFVGTCERAAFVSGLLSEAGVDNVALHSLLSQGRRLASLGKFKSELVRVLVATDVASRGLDVPAVDLVVNAELPRSPVSYVHRVGRTVRFMQQAPLIKLCVAGLISPPLTELFCLLAPIAIPPLSRPAPGVAVGP